MKLWIARDIDETLYLSFEKPTKKYGGIWNVLHIPYSHGAIYDIESDEFPEVTFENSPQRVEINLIKKA